MATASKRLTRKELKEPDKFLVLTQRTIDFVRERRSFIIAGLAFFVAVLIGIAGWKIYKSRQQVEAGAHFSEAVSLYRAEQHKQALEAFEKVKSYRWSQFAALAYLYEANSLIALKDFNRAFSSAQRFVSSADPNSLYRQLGLVTLAYVEEQKGQCRDAVQHYAEAAKMAGPYKDRALLGKGRCYSQMEDGKAAVAAYREYLAENPASSNSASITLQIAELESKSGGQPATK